MQHIISILCYHFGESYSLRKTATYSRVSFSAARDYVHRAKRGGLALVGRDHECGLKARLFPNTCTVELRHPVPDWAEVYETLFRKGQTLQLVYERYLAVHPGGYSHSRFCALYRA